MAEVEQYLENQRKHDIEPIEALLSELKATAGIEIELDPSYTPGLRRAQNLYVDYKLHEKSAAIKRILNVLIDEFEYVRDSNGNWSFRPETAARVKSEIMDFWSGESTERVRTKYIPEKQ